jgi:hypothetical protein
MLLSLSAAQGLREQDACGPLSQGCTSGMFYCRSPLPHSPLIPDIAASDHSCLFNPPYIPHVDNTRTHNPWTHMIALYDRPVYRLNVSSYLTCAHIKVYSFDVVLIGSRPTSRSW